MGVPLNRCLTLVEHAFARGVLSVSDYLPDPDFVPSGKSRRLFGNNVFGFDGDLEEALGLYRELYKG